MALQVHQPLHWTCYLYANLEHCTNTCGSSLKDDCSITLYCAAGGEIIPQPSGLHQLPKFGVVDDGERSIVQSNPAYKKCATPQVS